MHGPSHGGGSSFGGGGGGGFSSGGSSFSSDSGSNFTSSGGPRTYFFFGRPLFITNGMFSWIVICIVALSLCFSGLFSGIADLRDANAQIADMEESSTVFENVILFAEEEVDGYYEYTAKNINFRGSQGVFEDGYTYYGYSAGSENSEYWIVANYEYTYENYQYFQLFFAFTDARGERIRGVTYAQFGETKISSIRELSFSYKDEGDGEVIAINSNFSLTACIDYEVYKDKASRETTTIIITSVVGAISIAVIIALIIWAVKRGKEQAALKQEQAEAEIEKTKAETDLVKEDIKKKNRKCAYCGSAIPDDADHCPACGSRQFDEHKK